MRAAKVLAVVCCFGLCGCAAVEFVMPEGPPSDEQISESYNRTKLKVSTSADVLAMIRMPKYEPDAKRKKGRVAAELLSQSKSVVASLGQKKKGYKTWFTMVTFDEGGRFKPSTASGLGSGVGNKMTAGRKYLLVADEKPTILFFIEPREGLRFDCEAVLVQETLDKPYANENARRIEILKQIRENLRKDLDEVGQDNKKLAICGMMINQALETVLTKLDASPVLATRLSDLAGLKFDHIAFDRGRVQMVVLDDIVKLKLRLGSFVKKYIGAKKYRCLECGYIYDPVVGDPGSGVKAGTSFENLPEDWFCPGCGAGREKKNWSIPKPRSLRQFRKRVGL